MQSEWERSRRPVQQLSYLHEGARPQCNDRKRCLTVFHFIPKSVTEFRIPARGSSGTHIFRIFEWGKMHVISVPDLAITTAVANITIII